MKRDPNYIEAIHLLMQEEVDKALKTGNPAGPEFYMYQTLYLKAIR